MGMGIWYTTVPSNKEGIQVLIIINTPRQVYVQFNARLGINMLDSEWTFSIIIHLWLHQLQWLLLVQLSWKLEKNITLLSPIGYNIPQGLHLVRGLNNISENNNSECHNPSATILSMKSGQLNTTPQTSDVTGQTCRLPFHDVYKNSKRFIF
jgi:hypothetical protein